MTMHSGAVSPRSLLVLAIASALVTSVANADSTETLVVTGQESVGSDLLIDSEQMDRVQASDLEDVFALDPDVTVGGGIGVAQKVYVRGLEDTMLNVTVDGATQAGSLFHHQGKISIEPELLKQVEVHAGAGDATNGPGALGGAIKFVTKDPEDLLREGEQFGALVKAGYSSASDSNKVSTTVFGRMSDNWSAMASLAHDDSDNYEDGSGDEVAGSAAEQQLGYFKIKGQITDAQSLTLSHERVEDEGTRPQRPEWRVSSGNPAYPHESRRRSTVLKHTLAPAGNDLVSMENTIYSTRGEIYQDGAWGLYNGRVDSFGFDIRNTSKIGDHKLVYGVDYRRDEADLLSELYADTFADGDVAGLYIQDYFQLTDKLQLSFGSRYDRYEMSDGKADLSFSGFSPNLGFSYDINSELTLRGGYAEAMRGKEVAETFLLDSSYVYQDGLKEERAKNFELGFDFNRDRFSLSGTAYRSEIKDAIDYQRISGVRTFFNAGELENHGVTLRAGYEWDNLSAGISFAYQQAELNGRELNAVDSNGFGNSIGNTLMADLRYTVNNDLELGWFGRFVQGIDNLEAADGSVNKPGYGVHDVYARWLPTSDEDLSLTLTVKNLFDKQYIDHASTGDYTHLSGYDIVIGNPEPGRDVRLTMAWRM